MTIIGHIDTTKIEREELRVIDCREKVEELIHIISKDNGKFQKDTTGETHRPPSLDELMGTLELNAHGLQLRLEELRQLIISRRNI